MKTNAANASNPHSLKRLFGAVILSTGGLLLLNQIIGMLGTISLQGQESSYQQTEPATPEQEFSSPGENNLA